jgi:hypothetical protein
MKRDWKVYSLLVLLIVAFVAVVNEFFRLGLPDLNGLFTFEFWGGKNSRAETVRNLLLIIGIPLALWLAYRTTTATTRQADLAERGRNTDRFQKAVHMLGDEKLSVRQAGIVALRELAASDSESYYCPVQNLFCSFIRDQSQELTAAYHGRPDFQIDMNEERFTVCPPDIVEALLAMSALRTDDNVGMERLVEWRPNLSNAYMFGLPSLVSINLSYSLLSGAVLSQSNINRCNFKYSQFLADAFGTCFRNCDFTKTDFLSTDANFCNLSTGTEFHECNFTNAKLNTEAFSRSELHDCVLEGTELENFSAEKSTLPVAEQFEGVLN